MSCKEKINDIIDHRKGTGAYVGQGHLQIVQDKLSFFNNILNVLENYRAYREDVIQQIESNSGEHSFLAKEDSLYSNHVIEADPSEAINAVLRSIKELERLETRFNRDTINISVVGQARQGKSRLLQSISGLENEVVPADNGSDCTGAKSIICNDQNGMHAVVHFLSERELIDHVQKYLDALDVNIRIGTVSQIKSINTKLIPVGNSNKKDSYISQLEKYVTHYDEYADKLNTSIEISEKSEIRRYVSQYMMDGTRVYSYLGVKEVQIFTPFNYSDAGKIMLVDTIGIGDTAIGLRDKVVETMINDSDAAILVRRPDAEGDSVKETDNELYDLINEKMEGRDIEKWLFYALNIYENNQKSGNALYEQLKSKFGKTLKAAFIQKVNCADVEDVENNLLIPLLDYLSKNLADVDSNQMSTANKTCEQAYSEYVKLADKIDAVISECSIISEEEGDLFDQCFEDDLELSDKIKELSNKYHERNVPCEAIKTEIGKVLKNMKTHVPSEEEILKMLKAGGNSGLPVEVFHSCLSNLRTIIRDEFEEAGQNVLQMLEVRIKDEIIQILRDDDGGKLGGIPLQNSFDGSNNILWLTALIDEKASNYPLVSKALSAIKDYQINIKGLLEYKVDLALDIMDCEYPENGKYQELNIDSPEVNKDNYHNLISDTIRETLPIVGDELTKGVMELANIPYNSYCALVRKFYDRLFYNKQGIRDLKKFYRKNKNYIWREAFRGLTSRNEQMGKWEKIIDNIQQSNNRSNFIISI